MATAEWASTPRGRGKRPAAGTTTRAIAGSHAEQPKEMAEERLHMGSAEGVPIPTPTVGGYRAEQHQHARGVEEESLAVTDDGAALCTVGHLARGAGALCFLCLLHCLHPLLATAPLIYCRRDLSRHAHLTCGPAVPIRLSNYRSGYRNAHLTKYFP